MADDHPIVTVPYTDPAPVQPTFLAHAPAGNNPTTLPMRGQTDQTGQTSDSIEKLAMEDTDSLFEQGSPRRDAGADVGQGTVSSPPEVLTEGQEPRRASTSDTQVIARRSGGHVRAATVGDRLEPTMREANIEKTKYMLRAKWTGLVLNIAIGLQVVIGALITGLSAVTTGRHTSIMTSILGGFSTMVASYLARARGSGEPEFSSNRARDLDQFLRECETFKLDHGHVRGKEFDTELFRFRERFEVLMGGSGTNAEKQEKKPISPA